jgi:hypothetical protein
VQLRQAGRGPILKFVHSELETLLSEVESGLRVGLPELERAYTSGCAEILELEADAIRTNRRLNELRDQLRHIRTAIEWLQEERGGSSAGQ